MAFKRNYSYGLIGCGRIGERHAGLISSFGRLKAVCDIEPEKVFRFSAHYNAVPYSNLDDLLEQEDNIDVIVICTPNALHASQSVAALNKGFHVLCEKPMALQVSDCHKMVNAALLNGRMLLIVKQNRYNPPVVYLKSLMEKGVLGRIYSMSLQCYWNRGDSYYTGSNWKGTLDLDGGIMYTQFSHFIDIACLLFGKLDCIGAMGSNFVHKNLIEFDDTIVAIVAFEQGVLGTMHFSINAFERNMEGSLTVLGEKGAVTIGGEYLNKLTFHNVKDIDIPYLANEGVVNHYGDYKGTMNNHSMVYANLTASLNKSQLLHEELHSSVVTIDAIQSVNRKLENVN